MMKLTEDQLDTLSERLAEREFDEGDPGPLLQHYFYILLTGDVRTKYTDKEIQDLISRFGPL